MKALVISRLGDPEVLEVRAVPEPASAAGQELVQVEAGGINFADIMSAQGGYPGTPKPPLVAGREFCGTRLSDGQRVMGYAQWGAFAERVAASSQLLWPVPQAWSAEEGAAFPVNYFTAYFAYWKAGLLEPAAEQDRAASSHPRRGRWGGNRCGADWKAAGHRDVRNFFLGRKVGAGEGARAAARDQLQAERLRRSD